MAWTIILLRTYNASSMIFPGS